MKVAIGADHRGYQMKEDIKTQNLGLQDSVAWVDVGAFKSDEQDDYPDYAHALVEKIAADPEIRLGVIICGTGVGVLVVANKFKGIRCGLALNPDQVREAKEHDNINVLAISADYTNTEAAKVMVEVFLGTDFSRIPKYSRRIEKIHILEEQLYR